MGKEAMEEVLSTEPSYLMVSATTHQSSWLWENRNTVLSFIDKYKEWGEHGKV